MHILLHLSRGNEDRNAELATAAVKPAVRRLGIKLARVPQHTIPKSLHDLESDEVLCVASTSGLSAQTLNCLRWAVHKRHSKDLERVHRQLICDLNGGDEARVNRRPPRRNLRM